MAEVTAMRNNALEYPIYGLPYTVVFPMLDADGDLVTGATTPDAEVSKNGDTFADCTNESTEIATSSGLYYLILTGTEMTANIVAVIAKSATSGMKTTPIILYPRKLPTLRSGTAAGGAAGYITLDASASAVDDFYNGCVVAATIDGTVEVRVITDYTGSNQQASVVPDWNTVPDSDDTFIVYATDMRPFLDGDIVMISGDKTAADNAESFFDGTGYAGTNNVMPSVTTVTGNVNGSVGSVTGAVGSVTGAVGSVTGNVGGNVVGSVGSVVGDTPQTGDCYARLGAPAGASIAADIAAIASTQGAGALSTTVTITDGTNPIDGVEVWVSSDVAGLSVVAGTLTTDAMGVVTFMLDAGTYYVWKQRSGYNFTNPEQIVVA